MKMILARLDRSIPPMLVEAPLFGDVFEETRSLGITRSRPAEPSLVSYPEAEHGTLLKIQHRT